MSMPFVEDLGKAYTPKFLRVKLRKYVARAGIYKSPYELIGNLFWLSALITLFLVFVFIMPLIQGYVSGMSLLNGSMILLVLIFLSFAIINYALMVIFFLIGYFVLDIRVYSRTREIEENLSEFLMLVSTNLKGGMHIEAALWNSIKPKFGVLAEEITLVSKKVMTGYDVSEALQEFHDKYESPELKRTLNLIVSELEVGGRITKIVDDIVVQLKNTRQLKQKMVSSVLSYIIFISAITLVIAPALFALSFNLVNFISGFITKVGSSLVSAPGLPSFLTNLKPTAINPQSFMIFGFISVGTIAVFSSMIVSIIEKGDIKGGLKYIPVFLIVSLIVYYIGLKALAYVLGGITL